jgi:tellurite methyltransferase
MPENIARRERAGFAPYYAATTGAGPRPTLLRALAAIAAEPAIDGPRLAVDLGCGTGRDTLPMLAAGLLVLAVDRERDALAELRRRAADAALSARLVTRRSDFTRLRLPPVDLINASFCLPLCPHGRFPGLWRRIRGALRRGGRLACQLYGPLDDWAGRPGLTTHSHAEVAALCADLVVEWLDEEVSEAVTPRGRRKRWHIWHLVARAPVSGGRW